MEQFQIRGTAQLRALGTSRQAITGVNTSGNLEILVERILPEDESVIDVRTSAIGFRNIWEAVIEEFFRRAATGGLRFSINDGGARPDTVTLRLMQSVRLMEAAQ